MPSFNHAYYCKYTSVLLPVVGFVSGGLMHVMIYDVYHYYFKTIQPQKMTWKRLHNFSAYFGLTLGLSALYRGKPLFIRTLNPHSNRKTSNSI